MGLFGHDHMPVEGRTVLLTGGSEGTGLCVAQHFAHEGANIIIVARNPAKLEEALKSVQAAAKSPETQRFYTISADMAVHGYAERVIDDVTAWNEGNPPEIVWCLAGLSTPMLWTDDRAMEASRYNMDVNYFGSAEMARAIMRAWLLPSQDKVQSSTSGSRPAAKHIIFTGSVLSTFSMAGHGTYAPSKFALRALADALGMEVRLYPDIPIEVHLVVPNSITTAGYERENETKHPLTLQLEGAETPQTAEEVAQLTISGIKKGYYWVTTSFIGDLMRWGAMGNSPRNNWFIDTVMGWIIPFILVFVMWDMNTQVSKWGKKQKQDARLQN
ncbi:3-ketodihydrosphingosine reductase tsc-10 [Rostrohypoxylon terebratum]|nr:3-ketodihydrosphingosine reductase tsc-10 [Rostrohypoxylon terebratum]